MRLSSKNWIVLTITLLQVTDVLGDGDVLPMKALGNFFGIEFRNTNTDPGGGGFSQTLRYVISSWCGMSSYFVNPDGFDQAQVQHISMKIKPMNKDHDTTFSGLLFPQIQPNGYSSASGRLCFKSIGVPGDPVARLMEQYENKVISFWFGTYIL